MQKVTDPALLSQLNGGTAAPAPQTSAPGVIVGRPKQPSQVEQQRIAMEQERLRMSQQDQALQQRQAELSAQNTTLDIMKKQQAAAAGPAGEATEGERKASGFLKRALNAETNYGGIDFNPDQPGRQPVEPRSYIGQKLAEGAPDFLNSLPAAVGNSEQRQMADQAQREFIAAILRYDSGAAIPDSEFVTNAKIYFPQPGDTDAVIAQKAQARRVAIEGLRDSAGRLGTGVNLDTTQRDQQAAAPGLPNAALGNPDPGPTVNGVQDAGTGGMKAIPELRGMSEEIKALIQQGAPADQIVAYANKRSADAGYGQIAPEQAQFISDVVAAHQQRPDVPVGSLGTNWQQLEMIEAGDTGGTVLGGLADSAPGAAAIGAADVVTAGYLDEITGALGGNTDNARAVMKYSQQERPVPTFAGQLAGGAVLPVGRAGSVASLAKNAGAYGAAYGSGSAEGSIGDRLTGAAIGGAVGAVTGGLVGKGQNALVGRGAATTARQTERNALLQDFKDQGVTALPANVGGAPTRVATSGAGQAFFSSGSIRNALEQQTDEFGGAIANNAAKAGSVLPADEAGMLARTAGERFSKETSQRGSRLYERAYAEAGDVKITPQSAIAEIDAKIARLSQSPDPAAAKLVKDLETFKGKLAKGVSVVGLRDARTRLSQGVYDGGLRSSADQQVYRDVLGKVSDDIERGLRDAGKDRAANMFRTADKYWSERVDYIDSVLEPIISKSRSGEDILASVESMATGKKGGVDRLRGLMRSLSDEERGNVQATIIDRLGKASKGQQNAEGDAFSAATFLTNWNGMSQKGKAALFGNSELRQSLDQIARVAGSMKDASKYTNTSNTAGALGWQVGVSAGTAGLTNLPTAILAAGGQYLTGKLLASPKFAAWLARAPRNPTASAQRAYVSRLKNIAATEPAVAADVNRFAQFLNAANDVSPTRAAAEGQQENN
jgi:hypothetical protein